MGRAAARRDSGSFDAAAITTFNVRNNWGRIHVNANDWSHAVTFGVSTQNVINQTVCQNGYKTTGMDGLSNQAARCGVVSSLSFRPTFSHEAAFDVAGYQRTGGDSGAGVDWPTGFGLGAAGLHSRTTSSRRRACSRDSPWSRTRGLQVSPF